MAKKSNPQPAPVAITTTKARTIQKDAATLGVRLIALSKIKPYPQNAKKHNEEQIEKIVNSIVEFGFLQPIVLDKKNVIVVGHGRYEAARRLNLAKVPAVQVALTRAQAQAYRIADNTLSGTEYDYRRMLIEIKQIDLPHIQLENIGIDPLYIEKMALMGERRQDKKDRGDTSQNINLSYTLIFDTQEEQEQFFAAVKQLKTTYPDEPTVARRIIAAIL